MVSGKWAEMRPRGAFDADQVSLGKATHDCKIQ